MRRDGTFVALTLKDWGRHPGLTRKEGVGEWRERRVRRCKDTETSRQGSSMHTRIARRAVNIRNIWTPPPMIGSQQTCYTSFLRLMLPVSTSLAA